MSLIDALHRILTDELPAKTDELYQHDPLHLDFPAPLLVNFTRLSNTAVVPTYATDGSAGLDLVADMALTIYPDRRGLVHTNIAIALPQGYEGQVRSRSGLALKHGITVLNSPGTIDSDYRGGIGVILHNASHEIFRVKPGDRIAQLVVAQHERVTLREVDDLDVTDRGEGGFGSTGIAS